MAQQLTHVSWAARASLQVLIGTFMLMLRPIVWTTPQGQWKPYLELSSNHAWTGGKVSRDAGPVKGGDSIIAFVDDPTGYKWEIIGSKGKPIPEPIAQVQRIYICMHVFRARCILASAAKSRWNSLCPCSLPISDQMHLSEVYTVQVMLRVTDLDKSIKYYTEALGMQLIKKKDNPDYKYTLAFLGYGPEEENVVFELTYNWWPPTHLLCTALLCEIERSCPIGYQPLGARAELSNIAVQNCR